MGKLIVLVVIGGAIYAGHQIHTRGLDAAFGGALAGFTQEGRREAAVEVVEKSHFYQRTDIQDPAARRVPVTQAVRERVTSSMETSGQRQDRSDRRAGL